MKTLSDNAVSVRFFDVTSPEYQAACHLRDDILRRPLGLCLSEDDTAHDHIQIHLGAFQQNTLVGCVSAAKLTALNRTYQIRQMAISNDRQGFGIGKRLMQAMEKHLDTQDCQCIQLAARISAQRFYEKLGYTTVDNIFMHNTVEHIMMTKHLNTP